LRKRSVIVSERADAASTRITITPAAFDYSSETMMCGPASKKGAADPA
jgi:hypothetical protein